LTAHFVLTRPEHEFYQLCALKSKTNEALTGVDTHKSGNTLESDQTGRSELPGIVALVEPGRIDGIVSHIAEAIGATEEKGKVKERLERRGSSSLEMKLRSQIFIIYLQLRQNVEASLLPSLHLILHPTLHSPTYEPRHVPAVAWRLWRVLFKEKPLPIGQSSSYHRVAFTSPSCREAYLKVDKKC
jgi:hypothetical protein